MKQTKTSEGGGGFDVVLVCDSGVQVQACEWTKNNDSCVWRVGARLASRLRHPLPASFRRRERLFVQHGGGRPHVPRIHRPLLASVEPQEAHRQVGGAV